MQALKLIVGLLDASLFLSWQHMLVQYGHRHVYHVTRRSEQTVDSNRLISWCLHCHHSKAFALKARLELDEISEEFSSGSGAANRLSL